jgi:hypothetical protein
LAIARKDIKKEVRTIESSTIEERERTFNDIELENNPQNFRVSMGRRINRGKEM